MQETLGNPGSPHIITVGNEKGGTGKSTTAMHLVVALLKHGYRVGAIDLDGRQGTLSDYLENRTQFMKTNGTSLICPVLRRLEPKHLPSREESEAAERAALAEALQALADQDIVVIDTPGSDSHLARLGHGAADTLVTPLNDSLLDIHVLARIDTDRREVQAPSNYTKLVWEQNNLRVVDGLRPIDWLVLRNRLSFLDAHNKRDVGQLLHQLSRRIGFRLFDGFGERVIFRQLFLSGLTLLDLPVDGMALSLTGSHEAARREIDELLQAIGVAGDAAQSVRA
ncbi:MAG: division plane positioning ATPase MipZ [Pseudomonadota bacterium]